MSESRVTARQFFSLLYLSLLSSIFMYISSAQIYISKTEALLRPLIFIVISIIAMLPSFFIYKRFKMSEKTGENTEFKKTAFFKVVAGLYAVVYLIGIIRSVARFDLFASSELFPGSDMTFFIIALIAVCALLSLLGLGALSRAGGIFIFIVIFATGFVMLSLWQELDFLNFTPLFENGVLKFLWDGLLFGIQASEIGTIILFIPEIKGNISKGFIWWAILSSLTFIAVLFFVIGTLGVFADTQLFPTYTAVTLAKFGLLERMDALETAIWILCVVEKISFYFLVVTKCIRVVLPQIPKTIICGIVAIIVSAVVVFISGDLEKFGFVSFEPLVIGMYVIPVILLPIAIIIYLKRMKFREKSIENN